MKPDGNVSPLSFIVFILDKTIGQMIEDEEKRYDSNGTDQRKCNPQKCNQPRVFSQLSIYISPVSDPEHTTDQEITDALYKLCAHELCQECSDERSHSDLHKDDQKDNPNQSIQERRASARHHDPVKRGQNRIIRHDCVHRTGRIIQKL